MEDLRYPIGRFKLENENLTEEQRQHYIQQIAEAPNQLRKAVQGLTKEQLDTPYRPEGWTLRQVVHHLPDSHLNSYIRFKLALTEDEPVIKTYDEVLWAKLSDSQQSPIEVSLDLFETLQKKWVLLLKSMTPAEYTRKFRYPDMKILSLNKALAVYSWHGKHHIAHITSLRERMGWNQ